MSLANYQPPVSELLSYGDRELSNKWPDYIEKFNLEPQHIPELIRMATDKELNEADSESPEVWGPIHAWRALGQLKAIAAIEPLLDFLSRQDDLWISEDFPDICLAIGLEIIPLLEKNLADSSREIDARISVMDGLIALSKEYPETRAAAIATMTGVLEEFNDNDPDLNGILVSCLVELRAVESIETIERAFNADRINTFFSGTWEGVQVELDLKTWDDFPERKAEWELKLKAVDRFFEHRDLFKNPFKPIFPPHSSTRKPKASGFGSSSSQPKKKKSRRASKRKKKR